MNLYKVLAAPIVVASLVIGRPAKADVQYIGGSGCWIAFKGLSVDGSSLCGMSTTVPSARSMLMVRWFAGKGFFEVNAAKVGWQIPPASSTAVVVSFDGSDWPVTAYANDADRDHNSIIWRVTHDQVQSFAHMLATSNVMTVTFKEGTEPPWSLRLNGSSDVLNKFSACVLAIGAGDAGNPFAYTRTTQPVVIVPVQPEPTQPMAAPAIHPNA